MRHLILICWLFTSLPAMAATTPNVWKPEADAVCRQMDQAVSLYQQGHLKEAKLAAVMAYFKGYDANIEPAVRITLGGPHVFAIERQFRHFSQEMTPNPDKQQLQKMTRLARTLCQLVHDDANALNAAKVTRKVFNPE
ncbi:MAG: hypothetical protein A3E85_03300 [Gammaproteobacteria bacterium RIFCSPHIGHO2_12_FULL_45_12]|nr:MAG: hypothetical protein A3E85_03300 [Gammaproteobacteria bacterium RIFCSPHIGHO2_12_FULL_45_12]